MSRFNKDPNRKSNKVYGDAYGHYLMQKDYAMHDSTYPVNEIMWYQNRSFSKLGKSVSLLDMRYIEYNVYMNESTRPFKKHF